MHCLCLRDICTILFAAMHIYLERTLRGLPRAFLAPSRHYAGLLRKVLLRHADVAPLSIIHFAMTSLQNE